MWNVVIIWEDFNSIIWGWRRAYYQPYYIVCEWRYRGFEHKAVHKGELCFEGLYIDKRKRIVVRKKNEIDLTYTEFEILLLLAQNAGIVFSKEQIYNSVWKEPYFGDYNIVMSHIRNIREKIEDNPSKPVYIQTVWGVGYRFNQALQIREML